MSYEETQEEPQLIPTLVSTGTPFKVMPRAVLYAMLHDRRFDFSKRQMKVILHLMSIQPFMEGSLRPSLTYRAEIWRDIGISKSDVNRTLNFLLEHKIIFHRNHRWWVNEDPATWKVPNPGEKDRP